MHLADPIPTLLYNMHVIKIGARDQQYRKSNWQSRIALVYLIAIAVEIMRELRVQDR